MSDREQLLRAEMLRSAEANPNDRIDSAKELMRAEVERLTHWYFSTDDGYEGDHLP
jgi:hypothetical protein